MKTHNALLVLVISVCVGLLTLSPCRAQLSLTLTPASTTYTEGQSVTVSVSGGTVSTTYTLGAYDDDPANPGSNNLNISFLNDQNVLSKSIVWQSGDVTRYVVIRFEDGAAGPHRYIEVANQDFTQAPNSGPIQILAKPTLTVGYTPSSTSYTVGQSLTLTLTGGIVGEKYTTLLYDDSPNTGNDISENLTLLGTSQGTGNTINWQTGTVSEQIYVRFDGGAGTGRVLEVANLDFTHINDSQPLTIICPTVSITATPSLTIASGGSVTLTASGADSYTWSNGVQSTSVVLTNVTSATTLSVTGTTGACSATASAAITVTACSLTTTISGRLDRCPGGTTSLTAVGPTGANYRWSSGENTAVISASLSTQYSVTVTGTDNCTATATRQVTTRALPTVSITPTPSLLVCPGTSVTLTATSGLSYSWSSGANTAFISFVPTSITVLSVTANDGVCSSQPASVTVTVLPSVTATITPNPGLTICASAGGLLMASGGSGLPAGQGGTYLWSTNVNTAQITVNSSGPYTVTATNSAGCSGTATVSITALNPFPLAQPVLSASSSVVCEGGSASVTATVTGSVQTYQWYRNGISLGSAQSSSVLNGVSQAGSYVLVIGTSGCGSATSTAFMLTVNPLPTVTIAFPTSASVNPAGPVVTAPVGQGLTYQVFGGMNYFRLVDIDRINGFFIGQTYQSSTGIFPIDRAGPYRITVTDANGCSRTVTGEIRGQ